MYKHCYSELGTISAKGLLTTLPKQATRKNLHSCLERRVKLLAPELNQRMSTDSSLGLVLRRSMSKPFDRNT